MRLTWFSAAVVAAVVRAETGQDHFHCHHHLDLHRHKRCQNRRHCHVPIAVVGAETGGEHNRIVAQTGQRESQGPIVFWTNTEKTEDEIADRETKFIQFSFEYSPLYHFGCLSREKI